MKRLGMDIPYVGSHGIANAKFIELAGDAAEGVVFPAGRLLVPSSITDPKQKAVTDLFVEHYTLRVGSSPEYRSPVTPLRPSAFWSTRSKERAARIRPPSRRR